MHEARSVIWLSDDGTHSPSFLVMKHKIPSQSALSETGHMRRNVWGAYSEQRPNQSQEQNWKTLLRTAKKVERNVVETVMDTTEGKCSGAVRG